MFGHDRRVAATSRLQLLVLETVGLTPEAVTPGAPLA